MEEVWKERKKDPIQSTHKSKEQPKPTCEENLQSYLRNHFTSDLPVKNGYKDVSRVSSRDNSFISENEGVTSGSCKYHVALL